MPKFRKADLFLLDDSLIIARYKPDWLEMVEKILPMYGHEYTLMQMIFHILYY